jgi:hypothetical protein
MCASHTAQTTADTSTACSSKLLLRKQQVCASFVCHAAVREMPGARSVRLKHDSSDYIATQMKPTIKAEITSRLQVPGELLLAAARSQENHTPIHVIGCATRAALTTYQGINAPNGDVGA